MIQLKFFNPPSCNGRAMEPVIKRKTPDLQGYYVFFERCGRNLKTGVLFCFIFFLPLRKRPNNGQNSKKRKKQTKRKKRSVVQRSCNGREKFVYLKCEKQDKNINAPVSGNQ